MCQVWICGSALKICYVAVDVAVPYFRGASTHVYEVAKHLAERGHEVHVVSRRLDLAQRSYEFLDGFHIHRVSRGFIVPLPFSRYTQLEGDLEKPVGVVGKLYEAYLFTIYALIAGLVVSHIVKNHHLDVIIERETSFGAGATASILTGRPMVLEVIGPRYSGLSIRKATRIFLYTKLMVRDSVPLEKLIFVTSAVDLNHFKPDSAWRESMREKLGLGDSTVIGYVGTFASWHGIEELVSASPKLLKEFPKARFLMVGPYYEHAKRLVATRGILGAYLFTGAVSYSDVPQYMNASDILVAPYNPEKSQLRAKYGIGSPLKVFEYMACAKPIITTSVEPITQVIQNAKTGILIPPGNKDALFKAIAYLINNSGVATSMGRAAREEVESHYSWDAFVRLLENVLKEILQFMTG